MKKTDYVYGKAAIGICIKKIDKESFSGTIRIPYHKEDNTFHDVVEFLLLLEEILDERGFPNAMYKKRSLKKNVVPKKNVEQEQFWHTKEQMDKFYENTATFMVYITGRKYGSLQGRIICLKTGNVIKYQSELELICLMEQYWNNTMKKEKRS